MIPFSDRPRIRRRTVPYVMLSLIVLNVAVFIYELTLGSHLGRFVEAYGVIPYEITRDTDIPPQIPLPVYVTLFTSMFIHAGWLHLFGNMLFLWVFGDNVEDQLGHFLFLLFYLIAGLAANVTQIAFSASSTVPGIGASGAISGVLAAYLIMFPRAPVYTLIFFLPIRIPAFVLIGFWILLQFVYALASIGITSTQMSSVAFWAHVGGFIAGALMMVGLRLVGVPSSRNTPRST